MRTVIIAEINVLLLLWCSSENIGKQTIAFLEILIAPCNSLILLLSWQISHIFSNVNCVSFPAADSRSPIMFNGLSSCGWKARPASTVHLRKQQHPEASRFSRGVSRLSRQILIWSKAAEFFCQSTSNVSSQHNILQPVPAGITMLYNVWHQNGTNLPPLLLSQGVATESTPLSKMLGKHSHRPFTCSDIVPRSRSHPDGLRRNIFM